MTLIKVVTDAEEKVGIRTKCLECGAPYDGDQLRLSIIICEHCGTGYIPYPEKVKTLTTTIQTLQEYKLEIPDLDGPAKIKAQTSELEEAILGLYNSPIIEKGLRVKIEGNRYDLVLGRYDDNLRILMGSSYMRYTVFLIQVAPLESEEKRKGGLFSFFSSGKEPQLESATAVKPEETALKIYGKSSWGEYDIPDHYDYYNKNLPFIDYMNGLAEFYLLYPQEIGHIRNMLGLIPFVEKSIRNHEPIY